MLFHLTNVIIHAFVQNKLSKMKPSTVYNDLKQQREEIEEEVEKVRKKLIRGYKKEYYKVIIIIIMTFIILYCNGINYLSVLRLTDGFGFNEAYFTFLLFSLLVPVFCTIFCVSVYFYKKIKKINENKNKTESRYPKIYELVKNVFLEEGISKPIEVEIYSTCNVEISEEKNKIKISISWILLKFLTEEELKSVLYHEIGHYLNQDTKSGATFKKYSDRLDILLPMGVQAFYAPFSGKVIYETSKYRIISNVLFERIADDAVLAKEMGDILSLIHI